MAEWLPLFPLEQPLFPGLRLDLKIFEQRYIKLVKSSLREDTGFGICAIHEGNEVGVASSIYQIGVEARIVDWQQLENGLLGISVEAGERFSFDETEVDTDGLIRAQITRKKSEQDEAIPEWCSGLVELYAEIKLHPEVNKRLPEVETQQSTGLGNGLAQILPMEMEERIHCLSMSDAVGRLEFLIDHIEKLSTAV